MKNRALINSVYWDCEGATNYDGDLHLTLAMRDHTLSEFISLIETNTKPIIVVTENPLDSEEEVIVGRFVGYTYLASTNLTYDHTFTDQTVGTMLYATLTEEPIKNRVSQSETDITDIQMAVAELAEMIAEGD